VQVHPTVWIKKKTLHNIHNEAVTWNIGVFCDIFEWKMANWVCCDCPN